MEITQNLKHYIKMHEKDINEEEWSNVFGKNIYDATPLTFEEIDALYEILINSEIYIDLIRLSRQYKLLDTYLRDENEALNSFTNRVERDFYDKFYTDKFASMLKEKTFEEIYQGIAMMPTFVDSDFSGSHYDDKPTFIESFLILSEFSYPIFRVNFLNETTND